MDANQSVRQARKERQMIIIVATIVIGLLFIAGWLWGSKEQNPFE